MLLFGFFLVLIGFQVLSAWSCGKLVFRSDYPFYEVVGFGSSLLQVLIFIELVWGMSFLKEACNFLPIQSTSSFLAMLLAGTTLKPMEMKRTPTNLKISVILRF
jgi:hypothetical protein